MLVMVLLLVVLPSPESTVEESRKEVQPNITRKNVSSRPIDDVVAISRLEWKASERVLLQ